VVIAEASGGDGRRDEYDEGEREGAVEVAHVDPPGRWDTGPEL
jgi:hypothetical protein